MFVTLLVTVCLNLGVSGSCVTEPVVNLNHEQVTMTGCLGLEGFESAKNFGNTTSFIATGNLRGGHAKSVIAPRLSMARSNDSNHFDGFCCGVWRADCFKLCSFRLRRLKPNVS
jgi:hypothetical protein